MVEIQRRGNCIEEHIDELRKDMTNTLQECLEAVSGLRGKMNSSASTGLSAAEVAESVVIAVQSMEKTVDICYAGIQRELSVLGKTADAINSGVQDLAQELSDIKVEIVRSNQEILEQLHQLASSSNIAMKKVFELDRSFEDSDDEARLWSLRDCLSHEEHDHRIYAVKTVKVRKANDALVDLSFVQKELICVCG